MSSQKPTLLLINNLWNNEGGVERLISLYIDAWRTRYDIVLLGTIYDAVATAAEKWQLPAFFCFIDFQNVVRIYSVNMATKNPFLLFLLRHSRIAKLFSVLHGFSRFLPLSKLSFDIVLAMKEGVIMKFGTFPPAKKRLAFVHTDYKKNPWPQSAVFSDAEEERLLMTTYNHVLCVSEQVRQGIFSTIGDPGNLLVRYNPIPIETIRRHAGAPPPPEISTLTTDSFNQTNKRIRFVMIGRLCEQKGQDLLLDACARLDADGLRDRYAVWIAGDPERFAGDSLGKTIQTRAKAEQITSVHFLGFLENPYPLLAAADWFLSTSRWEGQSISTQEAAVLGVPLLVTDCAGVRELLGEEDPAGIIMDISAESIYENMKRVILQPNLREIYRQKVLRCAEKIDFDTRLQAIEDLFALPM